MTAYRKYTQAIDGMFKEDQALKAKVANYLHCTVEFKASFYFDILG